MFVVEVCVHKIGMRKKWIEINSIRSRGVTGSKNVEEKIILIHKCYELNLNPNAGIVHL